jgi:hypothetical protein
MRNVNSYLTGNTARQRHKDRLVHAVWRYNGCLVRGMYKIHKDHLLLNFVLFLLQQVVYILCNGPTNALVCNKTLIQMSHAKTFKITPTCFDHQLIIIREFLIPVKITR